MNLIHKKYCSVGDLALTRENNSYDIDTDPLKTESSNAAWRHFTLCGVDAWLYAAVQSQKAKQKLITSAVSSY